MKHSLGEFKAVLDRQKEESANLKLGKWKIIESEEQRKRIEVNGA